MNKKIFFLILSLTFLTVGTVALAQSDSVAATNTAELPAVSVVELPSAGITPDSPFYFIKSWKESIQTFFTFGAENKAKQFLHLADVRLAEYLKMVEKGRADLSEKTLEKYKSQLDRALEKYGEQGTVGEKVSKHQEVLKDVLEKVPEAARSGIEKALEASKEVKIKIDEFDKLAAGQKIEDGLKNAPAEIQSCIKSVMSKISEIKGIGDVQKLFLDCLAPGTKIPSVGGGVISPEFIKKIQEIYGKNLSPKDSESLNKLMEGYGNNPQTMEVPDGQEIFNLDDIKNLQEKLQKDLDEQYKGMTPEELEYLKKMQEQGELENAEQIQIPSGGSGMGL